MKASDLADLLMLREDMGHLSVIPTLDGKKWRASFMRRGEKHYTVHEHENVATAILLAVGPQKGQSVEGLTNEVSDWLILLGEAEKRRKQPFPHQTIDELVEKLPEKVTKALNKRPKPKDDAYDFI